MAYEGPEYWYVIYKAIGDFGGLMRDAAEAKAALQGMSDAVKAESAAEVAGATQAAAARGKDIATIQQETQALQQLANAAKATNTQLLYGGRQDMTQHLSDLAQELNYTTLLNRQQWLGFSSVQQAMSYRQQMYNLALLENRAHFAGYQTADQYLSFLMREVADTAALTSVIRSRTAAVTAETTALLAHTNALQGTHQTLGALGEQLGATASLSAAVSGIPGLVSTRLVVDDAAAMAELSSYRAALEALPHAESTDILAAATRLGGVPLTPQRLQVPVTVVPRVAGPVSPLNLPATVRPAIEAAPVQQLDALSQMLGDLNRERVTPHVELAGAQEAIRQAEDLEGVLTGLVWERGTEDVSALSRSMSALPEAEGQADRALAQFADQEALAAVNARALADGTDRLAASARMLAETPLLSPEWNRLAAVQAAMREGELATEPSQALGALGEEASQVFRPRIELEGEPEAAEEVDELSALLSRLDRQRAEPVAAVDPAPALEGIGAVEEALSGIPGMTETEADFEDEAALSELDRFIGDMVRASQQRYTYTAEFDDTEAEQELEGWEAQVRNAEEEARRGLEMSGAGQGGAGSGGGGPPGFAELPNPDDEEAWNALAAAEKGAAAQAVETAQRFLNLADASTGATEAARYMTAAVRAQTLAQAASAAGVHDADADWAALAEAERAIGAQALESVVNFQELAGATNTAANAAKLMSVATNAQAVAAKADAIAQLQDAQARRQALPNPGDNQAWAALAAATDDARNADEDFDEVLQGHIVPSLENAVLNIRNLAEASDSAHQQMLALNAIARLLSISQDDLNASNDETLRSMVQLAAEADNLAAAYGAANAAARRFEELSGAAGGAGGGGIGGGNDGGTAGAAPDPGDEAAWAALAAEMDKVAAATKEADSAAKAATGDEKAAADAVAANLPSLIGAASGWLGLTTKIQLFSGVVSGAAGQVAVWHIVMDGLVEVFSIWVPALAAAVVGIAAFVAAGILAGDTLGIIHDRMIAMYTVTTATGQAFGPFTAAAQKASAALANVVRPEWWQLLGDGLNILSANTGMFSKIAEDAGRAIDKMAATVTVDLTSATGGFQTFLKVGAGDLKQLGVAFSLLGNILLNLIKVSTETHVDQYLLDIGIAVLKLVDALSKIPTPILAVVLGLHSLWLWGGLLTNVFAAVLVPMRAFAVALGGIAAEDTAVAALADDASGFAKLRAVVQDIGAGFAAIPGRIAGFGQATEEAGAAAGGAAAEVESLTEAASGGALAIEAAATAADDAAADGAGFSRLGGAFKTVEDGISGVVPALGSFGGAAGEAGAEAEALGESAAVTAEEVGGGAGLTAVLGGLGRMLATAGAAIVSTTGLLVLAAAAVAAVTVEIVRANDPTLTWLNSLGQAKAAATTFTLVSTTAQQLAAVTTELGKVQSGAAGNASELQVAQTQLSDQLGLETDRVAALAKEYGTNMYGALALLQTAGVSTSAIYSNQSKVWAEAQAQVAGLVAGFNAMGQSLTQLGGDESVQIVTQSTNAQLAAMQKLNTAWDAWLKDITAGQNAFVAYDQDSQGLTTALSATGTSIGGLSSASLTATSDFTGMITAMGTVQDAVRQNNAILENGAKGSADLNVATKDLIASTGLLGSKNQLVQESLIAVAEEANPAITTWKQLTQWVGDQGAAKGMTQAAGASADLNKLLIEQQTQMTNVNKDAAALSTSLSGQLAPSMAAAIEAAKGGETPFENFYNAVANLSPASAQFKTAAASVVSELLAIDPTDAKNQFIAFSKAAGLSAGNATALWNSLTTGKGAITASSASVKEYAKQLSAANTAGVQLANGGIWSYFQQNAEDHFHDILVAYNNMNHWIAEGWDTVFNGFANDVQHPIEIFFTSLVPKWARSGAALAAGTWGEIWWAFSSGVAAPIQKFFTSLLPSWYNASNHALAVGWGIAFNGFANEVQAPIERFFTSLLPSWYNQSNHALAVGWGIVFNGFANEVQAPIERFFTGTVVQWYNTAAHAMATGWGVVWNGFANEVDAPLERFFTGTVPGWWNTVSADATKAWSAVASGFSSAVISPLTKFFTGTVPGWWNTVSANAVKAWNAVASGFSSAVVSPLTKFFTGTVPGWWNTVSSNASKAWSAVASGFNSDVVSPLSHFFTSTVPGWWSSLVSSGGSAWRSLWSGFLSDVGNPIINFFTSTLPGAIRSAVSSAVSGLVSSVTSSLSSIASAAKSVLKLASGGTVPMASGSVPGTGDEDGTHIVAMGGEYILRKPARMALQAAFGPEFLPRLNQADTLLGSGSRGNMASQRGGTVGHYASGSTVTGPVTTQVGSSTPVAANANTYQAAAALLWPQWEAALTEWKELSTWTTRPSGVTSADWQTWLEDRAIIANRVSVASSYIAPLFADLKNDPQDLSSAMWSDANSSVRRWQAAMDIVTLARDKQPAYYSPIQSHLASLQTDIVDAANIWNAYYGSGYYDSAAATSGTTTAPAAPVPGAGANWMPGPSVTPSSTGGGPTVITLAPLIIGGPAGQSALNYGFAAGGPVGLSGMAGMFSGGMANGGIIPTLNVPGLSPVMAKQLSAATSGSMPRTLSEAAGNRVGLQVDQLTINNPVAEKPSESITRATNRLAFLGGRGLI